MASDASSAIEATEQQLGGWLALRGLVTLLFGLLFVVRPVAGVTVLMGMFAAFCLLDGILSLASAITIDHLRSRAFLATEGLLSLAAGVIIWAVPRHVAMVVLVVIALRAIVLGAIDLVSALRLGKALDSPWLLAIAGLASILFGIVLLIHPQPGVLALAWLVGVYGLTLGAIELAVALGLGRMARHQPLLPRITHG